MSRVGNWDVAMPSPVNMSGGILECADLPGALDSAKGGRPLARDLGNSTARDASHGREGRPMCAYAQQDYPDAAQHSIVDGVPAAAPGWRGAMAMIVSCHRHLSSRRVVSWPRRRGWREREAGRSSDAGERPGSRAASRPAVSVWAKRGHSRQSQSIVAERMGAPGPHLHFGGRRLVSASLPGG